MHEQEEHMIEVMECLEAMHCMLDFLQNSYNPIEPFRRKSRIPG
jgi:hypothetical protein